MKKNKIKNGVKNMVSEKFDSKVSYEQLKKDEVDVYEFIVSGKGWNYLDEFEND